MTEDTPLRVGKPDHADFIGKALERFRAAAEAEQLVREEGLDDLRFFAGEQWPESVKKQRANDSRPCLTVNRLPQVVQQVTNEQRQSRPEVTINPVSDGADVETAEILQGLCRHIDIQSDASIAHDTAFECAVRSGFGYWRYITEYCDDTSFDQEIKVKRVLNPFTVYFDPSALEPDYSDAEWAFIIEDIPTEKYRAAYPGSELASLETFESLGDAEQQWATLDSVRVAEYFTVIKEKTTLYRLENGKSVTKADLPKARGLKVVAERVTTVRRVKWSKINACEVLEERDWPGKWIPIVPVLGTEIIVEGDRHLIGVVRYAKDSQRMYNYHVSAQTETIGLAPKAPYVAAFGQLEGFENDWKTANSQNHAVLQYNPISADGKQCPPPQRNAIEPPIAAISQAIVQSSNDIKATTGLYDDSLGVTHSDRSGRAVLARQKEGDTANLHLSDNLLRSIRHAGRIVLDLIPRIYDAPRIVRIVKPDDKVEHIAVNQPTMQDGIEKIIDLTAGTYDVTVSAGASYESRRQESVDAMLDLVKAYPALMGFVGDLLVKNMDWPGAQAVAERLAKMLPPQLQEQDPNDPAQQLQQKDQQLQQLSAQHEAMVEQLHKLTDIITQKHVEADARVQVALIQARSAGVVAELQAKSSNAQALLEAEMAAIDRRLELIQTGHQAEQDQAAQQQDQSHQAAMQQSQQDHQAGMQQGQQSHQAGMQASDQAAAAAAAEAQSQLPKAA